MSSPAWNADMRQVSVNPFKFHSPNRSMGKNSSFMCSYAPPAILYEIGTYGRTLDNAGKGFRFLFDKYYKTMYTENIV